MLNSTTCNAVMASVALLLCSLPATFAWGTLGHEIVANIAWSRLDSNVQDWISSVLDIVDPEDDNSPLGAVADWADQVRFHYHWSAALHYIDIRDDEITGGCPIRNVTNENTITADKAVDASGNNSTACSFEYTRDCPNDVCVAGAIQNYTSQLEEAAVQDRLSMTTTQLKLRGSITDSADDAEMTREAMKFLTHFIGDIHQPLHCSRSTDKGGNDFHVHFQINSFLPCMEEGTLITSSRHRRGQVVNNHYRHGGWNLHSVWDTAMIEEAVNGSFNSSRALFETYLMKASQDPEYEERIAKWSQCSDGGKKECTTQWGEEGWEAAIQYAYQNTDGTEVQNGSVLTQEYYATRFPIIQDRLIAAGVRLAETLKVIYSNGK